MPTPARQWLWLGFSVRFLAAVATREHSYTRCPIAGFGHAAGASLDWQGCLRADLGSRGAVWKINLEHI